MSAAPRQERVPRTFQSLKALRLLNVASVGLALAAVTGAVFAHLFGKSTTFGSLGVIAGLPTLFFGTLWAILLRMRATVWSGRVRWGWLASIPLAILNGGVACALLLANEGGADSFLSKLFVGLILGATLGALFWVPGLLLTLLFFGVPIAWSQRLAAKGLAGEERGEIVIGVASSVLAAAGLVLASTGEPVMFPDSVIVERLGYVLLWLFGAGGLATGGAAAVLAQRREARRRRFVREVEAGNVRGFRVDAAPEGKVLVRVTTMGEGYRVANFEEEVFVMGEDGEAKRATSALP